MKKIIILYITIFMFVLSSCSFKEKNGLYDTIKVGINLELSGNLSQYGANCLEGILIAQDKINKSGGIGGKKIQLVILDNSSQSSLASLTALKLEQQENVSAIIGPSTSSLFKASIEQEISVAMITPGATSDNLSEKEKPNVIRACYKDSVQGEILATNAYLMGFRNISFLTDLSSDYSCGISKSFKKVFENLGGEIYQEKFFNSSDVDFSSLITSFDINKTDAFFVPAYYDQGGVIIKQMRKFGINKPILSGDSFDSPALQEITGKNEYLTNVFFTNHTCFSEERKNINTEKFYFENEYLKKYKIQPAAYCALGYDSLMIFAKGYKNALLKESLPSKDNIINGIKSIKNQEFATGKISIDEKGNAIKTPVFVTFENGKQKQIILNSN